MVFYVIGDLSPILKWIETHDARIEERFSHTEMNVEIDDGDEVDFVELCEDHNVSRTLM